MGLIWDIFCDIMDPMSFNVNEIELPKEEEEEDESTIHGRPTHTDRSEEHS